MGLKRFKNESKSIDLPPFLKNFGALIGINTYFAILAKRSIAIGTSPSILKTSLSELGSVPR